MTTTPHQPAPTASESPEWMSSRQLAEWLQIPEPTLKNMRHRGDGPPAVRVGGRLLRFRRSAVEEWLAARTA